MSSVGIFVLLLILLVYSPWFSFSGTLSSGDWPYLFLENIREFSFAPMPQFLWLAPYYQIPVKIVTQYIGFPWEMAERIIWFWPFIVLCVLSSYYLTRSWIGVILYTTNTYILMVVGGGQMGVGMAYSIAPLVLARFTKLIQNSEFRIQNSIITGLVLAIQMMFDPRIAYVTMIAVILYIAFNFRSTIYHLSSTILIAILFNTYWIIPVLKNGLPEGVGTIGTLAGFEFLSFADFSHAFSLLHPNWPENIFGKAYFLQPEFLILPIIAFSSLLFRNSKVLFFASLGLLGAFLAKGTNPPFGEVNNFLFQYFPGINLFRDPTKFYLLIVLSYSVLIPHSLHHLSIWANSKFKIQNSESQLKVQIFFILLTFLYLIFILRPALSGQLTGTFKPQPVPQEYIQLKEFLKNDSQSFATLWVPQVQRFGFYSRNHPAIPSSDLPILEKLKEQKVKYVIVPYDSRQELFITDRKYDEDKYNLTIKALKDRPYLTPKTHFGRIVVFLVQ